MAARPSESETDSLGVSAESDASGRMRLRDRGPEPEESAGPAPAASAEDADILEYGQSLGADLTDADMMTVVREAFEAPLPSNWTEHVDADGRVYFFNQVSEESTWSHPMDAVYRELIWLILRIKAENPTGSPSSLEARAVAVRTHLVEVHERALSQLEGWSGPYVSDTGQYYFNERLHQSTWVSPINGWEYELAIRHSVLHRCLLAGYTFAEMPSQPSDDGEGADLLATPMLRLPLGLARREEDNQGSARSFYTARESARSGMSARSLGGVEGLSPSPVRRSASGPRRTPTPPEARLACGEAAGADDEPLEVTFGRTEALQMPVVGTN